MKAKPTVNPNYDQDEYVLFRTADFSSELNDDSKPFVVINKKNGDYDKLMEFSKNHVGFKNVPQDQNISCRFLRYRKADNEFLLDDLCAPSTIQVCRIELTTEGFKR